MNRLEAQPTGLFAPQFEMRVGTVVRLLALGMALLGGLVLVAMTLMTLVSITGRSLTFAGFAPVPGAFELVEAGTAFAVFSFLPWCQLQRGHVTVDVVAARFGPRVMAVLSFLANVAMALVAALIFWRLLLGLLDKRAYLETTFILQFPVWWSYLAASFGAGLFVIVCAYTAWRSANEMSGGSQTPDGEQPRQDMDRQTPIPKTRAAR
ncbi:MAG: TRAP transporter small permease [Pseudomonadota bacterium]